MQNHERTREPNPQLHLEGEDVPFVSFNHWLDGLFASRPAPRKVHDMVTITLSANASVVFDDLAGEFEILDEQGTLWLTREGESGDTFLSPGERITISPRRHTVVQALTSSRLKLRAA